MKIGYCHTVNYRPLVPFCSQQDREVGVGGFSYMSLTIGY